MPDLTTSLLNNDRFSLQYTVMRGSIAERVSEHVAALPERSFVAVREVDGPRGPIETAFSRLAAKGELWRVRKGLYWKGTPTPFGMSRPRTEEVALQLGGPGSGPAGVAAALWLGLTSQIPATFVAAVPTRVPKPWRHVRFTQRPVERLLRKLTPSEVAVLEVLRAGPAVIEDTWGRFGEAVARLAEAGEIRPVVLDDQVADEHHRGVRSGWSRLCEEQPALLAMT